MTAGQQKAMGKQINAVNRTVLTLAAVIFVAVGGGVLLGVQHFIDDARHVAHTNAVIANIDAAEARLRDAESAQRGYLLTGKVEYLAAYRINLDQLPPLVAHLESLVSDNPAQVARVQQFKALGEQRMTQVAGTLARFESRGLEAARAGIDDQALVVSSQVRLLAQQMVEHEETLLLERHQASQRSASLLRLLALLGIPLGLALLAGVYWRMLAEVARRARAERRSQDTATRLQTTVSELEHHSAGLVDLNRYASLLQNCQQAEEAVALTTDLMAGWLPGSAGSVYRIRASRDYAERLSSWGQSPLPAPDLVVPTECWSLRRGQLHRVEAGSQGARCAHLGEAAAHEGWQSVCIPLIAQGVQLGFFQIGLPEDVRIERMELVQAALEQLAMTLHTISLQEKLRVQSIRDPLTGLFNRRYLEEALEHERARSQRRGQPFSVLMLDVDHFKAFNDQQGHPGGDALLAGVGQLLRSRSRAEDIACRYGGEEFTVILPETTAEQARGYASALLSALAAMRVEHMGRELPAITASIGVAQYGDAGQSGEALVQQADRALYRAKREGRNRVVVDGDAALDDGQG